MAPVRGRAGREAAVAAVSDILVAFIAFVVGVSVGVRVARWRFVDREASIRLDERRLAEDERRLAEKLALARAAENRPTGQTW